MSVEGVDFVVFLIVKALHREVFGRRFYLRCVQVYHLILRHCFGNVIVKELMVFNVAVVKQIDEYQVVCDENSRDKGVREVVDRHREVVDLQKRVYV